MTFLNLISLRNKILLIVGLGLLSMVMVAIASYQAMVSAAQREEELRGSYTVIEYTRQMEASLHMMEFG
ncbi:hypothetical protein [uncultured Chloroflexus sp.]|uniref:hypothetical protein n=1 Tax=uncultured Chloroflexus sp. TaxID=214040 RepID=UPI00262F7545|nr:hypothetical protein [uncultured Chloroflexus sp.]